MMRDLDHREHNDSVFEFPRSKARSRNPLKLRAIFVKVTEGLFVSLKARRKPAWLSCFAERERKGDRPAAVRLYFAHDHNLLLATRLRHFSAGQ